MCCRLRNELLTCLHPIDDFVARSSDELSLFKGDRVELVERDDEFGDGWFLGRHLGNGNTGLFPEGIYASPLETCGSKLLTVRSLHETSSQDWPCPVSSTRAARDPPGGHAGLTDDFCRQQGPASIAGEASAYEHDHGVWRGCCAGHPAPQCRKVRFAPNPHNKHVKCFYQRCSQSIEQPEAG